MPSTSSKVVPRKERVQRAPQQERSARRQASILDAATALIVEFGFEGLTMTGIAERAGASVGALYDYFPDKRSIAFEILNHYAKEIESHWQPLIGQAAELTPEVFADQFIDHMLEFMKERPAFLPLVNAPIRYTRDPAARRATRKAFADAFRARQPSLDPKRALMVANIALQMISAMTTLFQNADEREKRLIAVECKRMFALYLTDVLSEKPASSSRSS